MAKGSVIQLRVTDEEHEAWKRAAAPRSLSAWARDLLNGAAEVGGGAARTAPRRTAPPATKATRAAAACERAHFHRPGVFCKSCGQTP